MTTDANLAQEGYKNGWWERDVFCLSAGPNQTIDTPFYASPNYGLLRGGDDFVFVIQGSGR